MVISQEARPIVPYPWRMIIASLLPLWLVSFAITVEGFPRPPISLEVAVVSLVMAVAVGLVLMWQRRMPIEIFVYSFFPLFLLPILDEISTTYKTPFIVLCALILTVGILAYHGSHASRSWRALMLLAVAGLTMLMAQHAAANFWEMAGVLGYDQCFPDGYGCPPLTGQETPWWALFFSP